MTPPHIFELSEPVRDIQYSSIEILTHSH